ncbi:iron transporter FeoB [Porphyromonas gingivalis SJD4]|nr:iron transporter FeoB [Porphyromonas gingivalis SJD4]
MMKKSAATSSACNGCPAHSGNKLRRMGTDAERYDFTIALAGNPNTGKSTVFNALTGLKQHTGNWPGKTVEKAEGAFSYAGSSYKIVDLPGTYSLLSTSEDEEIARDFILFGKPDVTLIVADATRLERNMNLILQILEITDRAVLCANLMDEAERNGVEIDLRGLSRRLGIPVVGASARSGEGISDLLLALSEVAQGIYRCTPHRLTSIGTEIDTRIDSLAESIRLFHPDTPNSRWLALRLTEGDRRVENILYADNEAPAEKLKREVDEFRRNFGEDLHDQLSEALYSDAGKICQEVITQANKRGRTPLDIKIDRIVTSRKWGFPIMLLMLALVLWITIVGSNYPSQWLSDSLVGILHPLLKTRTTGFLPDWLSGFLIDGVYLATAWVVSVMLPPMAIFFPLFTLLEDFGFLPRVAFNLDELFRRSGAHGKQALTMTMGFGCNAAAIINTRIIDSQRERLIAILTNNFSLCNGRWPTQILLATIFLTPAVPAYLRGVIGIGSVVAIALLGIAFMFFFSWVLSRTLLRGQVSTFNLELPPYRPPQFWQTIYKSIVDRTLVVLWRAVVFAAPAGALIWLTCNIQIGGVGIAEYLIDLLDGPGWLMGLNGVILLAYVLAIPANEIVIPTILMLTVLTTGIDGGTGAGVMFEADGTAETARLFEAGGWTMLTGINLMLFCLLHNPCSTTLFNIYKETGSRKWTLLAALIPLATGFVVTVAVAFVWRLVGG